MKYNITVERTQYFSERKVLIVQREPITCEYLKDNRLCKAVTESEGNEIRKKFCRNRPKNYCCYLCSKREGCEVSCDFLDAPKEPSNLDSIVVAKIERELIQYKKEKTKLAVLFADGKIGEKSYLVAIGTLESKIGELEKVKENPRNRSVSVTSFEESSEFEETSNSIARPSALWYLVPFFFGIIGGIVGYVGTKDEDQGMADGLLFFGIVWTIVVGLLYWAMLASLLSHF